MTHFRWPRAILRSYLFIIGPRSNLVTGNHDILLEQLRRLIPDARVLGLVEQYVRHTVYDGLYETVTLGTTQSSMKRA